MKLLINELKQAIEKSRVAAASRRPGAGEDPAYLLGYLQGKHDGFSDALQIVEGVIEAEDQKDAYK